MVYRVIGLMSGSSLDGLDVACVQLQEQGGKWSYELVAAACLSYDETWTARLANAVHLSAVDYQLLHTAYGYYVGQQVNDFIDKNELHHQVHLVASHGHTTFHLPKQRMTAQLGDGAAIAAATGLPVVSDLRAMDIAFGGQGAPIVPIGEKLLLPSYQWFLNLGGIANLSFNAPEKYTAFDVCPANRVLNMLAQTTGKPYDENGQLAATGKVHDALLQALNELTYYHTSFPKSLANDFGTGIIFPLIQQLHLPAADALSTYVEHIAEQIGKSVGAVMEQQQSSNKQNQSILITGGGAFNDCLVNKIRGKLQAYSMEVVVPDEQLINFKEAIVMALIGVLRWREEYNVLSSVTGALRSSINGALWLGGEA